MKKLLKFFLIPFFKTLHFFFPQQKCLVVFCLRGPQDWRDNLRFFYQELAQNPKVQCVLLSPQEIEGLPTTSLKTLRGFTTLLRARSFVIHHGRGDIHFYPFLYLKKCVLLNLWHGVPLKGIGYTNFDENEEEFSHYRATLCSSKIDRIAMASSFRLPFSKVWNTGLPRNDLFFKNPSEYDLDLQKESALIKDKVGERLHILYMPTWRDRPQDEPTFSLAEQSALNALLHKYNAVLSIKSHPNSPRFSFSNLDFIDINPLPLKEVGVLLKETDLLITDYSSVWVDFLLLDRPIVSYCYDFSDYLKDRQLIYDYDAVFPNRINRNFSEFLANLEECLQNPQELHSKQITSKSFFHSNAQGPFSPKIVDLFLKELSLD